LQPGLPYTPAIAGAAFGVFNSTVSKDVGLGAQRQVQFSLRLNFSDQLSPINCRIADC